MDDRTNFLNKLDETIWVRKRLFPFILIILDKVMEEDNAKNFIINIIKKMPNKFNILTNFPDINDPEFIEKITIQSYKDLVNNLNQAKIFTVLEQFLSDLYIYGLREALAYLTVSPSYKTTSELEGYILEQYAIIGNNFLLYEEDIYDYAKEILIQFSEVYNGPIKLDNLVNLVV